MKRFPVASAPAVLIIFASILVSESESFPSYLSSSEIDENDNLLKQENIIQMKPAEVQPGEAPFLVGLWTTSQLRCVGVLIKKDVVLTAASCMTNGDGNGTLLPLESFTIFAGEYGEEKVEESKRSLTISEVIIHPHYEENIWTRNINDIAIVRVNGSFHRSGAIQFATLPDENKDRVKWEPYHVNLFGLELCGEKRDDNDDDAAAIDNSESENDCVNNHLVKWSFPVKNDSSSCSGFELNKDLISSNQNHQPFLEFCKENLHTYSGSPTIDQYGSGRALFGIQTGACDSSSCVHVKIGSYLQWIESVVGKQGENSAVGGNAVNLRLLCFVSVIALILFSFY